MTHKTIRNSLKRVARHTAKYFEKTCSLWKVLSFGEEDKLRDIEWDMDLIGDTIVCKEIVRYGWICVLEGSETAISYSGKSVHTVIDTVARVVRTSCGHKHIERPIPIEAIPYIEKVCRNWKQQNEDRYESFGLLTYAAYVTTKVWDRI